MAKLYAEWDGHKVELPDDFSSLSAEQQQAVLDNLVADTEERSKTSATGAFGRAAAQSLLIGAGDEISGTLGAVIPSKLTNIFKDQGVKYKSIWDTDNPFSMDTFRKVRDENIDAVREQLRRDEQYHPTASTAGDLTGAVAGLGTAVLAPQTGLARVPQIAKLATKIAPAWRVTGRIAGSTASGAGWGFAGGYMSGEGDERFNEGVRNAVLGAAGGTVFGTGAEGFRKVADAVVRRKVYKADPLKFGEKYLMPKGVDPEALRNRIDWKASLAKQYEEHSGRTGNPASLSASDAFAFTHDGKASLLSQIREFADPESAARAKEVIESVGKRPASELSELADAIQNETVRRAVKDYAQYHTDTVMGLRGVTEGKDGFIEAAKSLLPAPVRVAWERARGYFTTKPQRNVLVELGEIEKYPKAWQALRDKYGAAPMRESRAAVRDEAMRAIAQRSADGASSVAPGRDYAAEYQLALRKARAEKQKYGHDVFVPPKRKSGESDEAYRIRKEDAFREFQANQQAQGSARRAERDARWSDAQEKIRKSREPGDQVTPQVPERILRREAAEAVKMERLRAQIANLESETAKFVPPSRAVSDTDEVYSLKVEKAQKEFAKKQEELAKRKEQLAQQQATSQQRQYGTTDAGVEKPIYNQERYTQGTQSRKATQAANADAFVERFVPEGERQIFREILQEGIAGYNNRAEAISVVKSALRTRLGYSRDKIDELDADLADIFSAKAHADRKAAEEARVIRAAKAKRKAKTSEKK